MRYDQHQVPISRRYPSDPLAIRIVFHARQPKGGNDQRALAARQPEAGSFPPFCEFVLHPPTLASGCDVVACELGSRVRTRGMLRGPSNYSTPRYLGPFWGNAA